MIGAKDPACGLDLVHEAVSLGPPTSQTGWEFRSRGSTFLWEEPHWGYLSAVGEWQC